MIVLIFLVGSLFGALLGALLFSQWGIPTSYNGSFTNAGTLEKTGSSATSSIACWRCPTSPVPRSSST